MPQPTVRLKSGTNREGIESRFPPSEPLNSASDTMNVAGLPGLSSWNPSITVPAKRPDRGIPCAYAAGSHPAEHRLGEHFEPGRPHEHHHQPAAYCARCDRWNLRPLAKLVEARHGTCRLPLTIRCRSLARSVAYKCALLFRPTMPAEDWNRGNKKSPARGRALSSSGATRFSIASRDDPPTPLFAPIVLAMPVISASTMSVSPPAQAESGEADTE